MKRLGLEGNKSPSPSGSVDGRPFGGAATENVRRTRFAPELDGVIVFETIVKESLFLLKYFILFYFLI
ncbi:hypothetical protein ACOSQ4_031921 [Xanthoceras sorbifolium]